MNSIILSILFLLTMQASSIAQNKKIHNDLSEYGLYGPVKSINSTYYRYLIKENEKPKSDDKLMAHKQILNFDKEGNLISKIDSLHIYDDEWDVLKTVYKYKNNFKLSFKQFDIADGNVIRTGEYHRISKRKYQLNTKRHDDVSIISTTTLNYKYRDLKGTLTVMKGDSIIDNRSYKNKLLKGYVLEKAEIKIHTLNIKKVLTYIRKQEDNFGNLTQVAVINQETKGLEHFGSRIIEYYK